MRRLLPNIIARFRDPYHCATCGGAGYDPHTATCLSCDDRSRAMHRAERAQPWAGYQERLITRTDGVWKVGTRWRDLEDKG